MSLSRATLEGWLAWRGREAVDAAGESLGRIADIYLDQRLEQPTWALLDLGPRSAFAPLHGAAPDGPALRLPIAAGAVRKAPTAPAGRELSAPMEAMLRRHYEEQGPRYAWEATSAPAGRPDDTAAMPRGAAPPRPAPEGAAADGATRTGAVRAPAAPRRQDATWPDPGLNPGLNPGPATARRAGRGGRRRRPRSRSGLGAAVAIAAVLALAAGVLLSELGPTVGEGAQPARMVVSGGPGDGSARRVGGGTFESGFDGWAPPAGGVLERTTAGLEGWGVIARAATGPGAARGPRGAVAGMVRHDVLEGAARGTRVRVSAWVRVTQPGADVDLRLVESRRGRQIAVDAKVVTVTDREWRRLGVSGVLDAAASDLDLQVSANGLGGGALLLDSVWLEVTPPGVPG